MSSSFFRRHQKWFLWSAVVFCVLVFGTFSGFGDIKAYFQGTGDPNAYGRFTVQTTNEIMDVTYPEWQRTRNALNRYRGLFGREAVSDNEVWQFLMLRADAEGAGIVVLDSEVSALLRGIMGSKQSKEFYREVWQVHMRFTSARECERFFHDLLLGAAWEEFLIAGSRILDADEVYVRWSSDTMRFDLEAVVIPDTPLDEISDPPRDELQSWFDEQPEALRAFRYVDPQKHDIVYAWLPLDADSAQVSDEALAGTGELTEVEIERRFNLLKTSRWPEAEAMDEEMRAAVEREVRIIRYVQQAREGFDQEEDSSEEAFRAHMTEAGLLVAETDTPLDAEGLKALDPIGEDVLPLWLGQLGEGQTHFGSPFRDQQTVYAVYIRGVEPSRPLDFEEGYDQILASWKEGRRNARALDWREALTEHARALPEAIKLTQPILDAAEADLAVQLAEQTDLDEEGQDALRKQIMDAADRDTDVRVAEFEHLAWDALGPPDGATSITLNGVPRSYGRLLDGEEDADSIERFIKTNGSVYRLAVDGVSIALRHAASEQTVIVRVMGTSLPPMDEMFADNDGMENSRRLLASQRQIAARQEFNADSIAASHGLQIVVVEEETPEAPTP